jgi:hypothetical protein
MSMIQDNPRLVSLASKYLSVPVGELRKNTKELPEIGAVYFWESVRGGGSILVGIDGSVLYAISAVSFDDHVDAFKDGRRTNPEEFKLPTQPQ